MATRVTSPLCATSAYRSSSLPISRNRFGLSGDRFVREIAGGGAAANLKSAQQKSYNLHNAAGLWNILKWIGHLKKLTDRKRLSKAAVCSKVLAPTFIPGKIYE